MVGSWLDLRPGVQFEGAWPTVMSGVSPGYERQGLSGRLQRRCIPPQAILQNTSFPDGVATEPRSPASNWSFRLKLMLMSSERYLKTRPVRRLEVKLRLSNHADPGFERIEGGLQQSL